MNPISIKGLSVSYERKRVLSNIFLEIKKGAIYGVVGPNGAGKSTLFKSILQLIDISAGVIMVLGEDIEEVRKRIAYVPQKDDVDWNFPALVNDIVLMGRYPHKKVFQWLNKEDQHIADEAMSELDILDLKNRQIGELSGGQQQRVFLARAMAQEAEIFLLDEPFVGVDMTTEEKIIKTLKRLAGTGKTMLVVHHDLSTVEEYFDHVILINQRLIAEGPTAQMFTQENISKTYGAKLNLLNKTTW
ncbi:metal ABC transporter ATP-binding protein [Portibacter marinus]|uniref:metal ABC transporter ATP-binding protein n=1 Tax=Portibacter marinus TaxID=2898660 RepID=UPI001F482AB9|nr:metal ABC transporter ATP-binding protein [Portibacter marinus]